MRAGDGLTITTDTLPEDAAPAVFGEVRAQVLRMKEELGSSLDVASEVPELNFLVDAPGTVARHLRRYCCHMTGIQAADYNPRNHRARAHLEKRLEILGALAEDRDLLVPEASILGGFGFTINGKLLNGETLRFFENLIALKRAAILEGFRQSSKRLVVWELESGWGGFAYQFKTLFQNTTYILSGSPQSFLFSGAYLRIAFPGARMRFWQEGDSNLFGSREEADFIFVPVQRMRDVAPMHLDLALSTVPLQGISLMSLRAFVERAYALNAPYLFHSIQLDGTERGIVDRIEAIKAKYWTTEVPMKPVPCSGTGVKKKVTPKEMLQGWKLLAKRNLDLRFISGWRRLLS